jgi:chromosome segregation ATPase
VGLFGNRERDEVKGRLDSAEAELAKVRKEMERERARSEEARKVAKAATDGLDALKAKLAETEAARDRAVELKAKAEQMGHWLEDRYNQAMAAAGTAGKAREDDASKATEAIAEAARLRSEAERLRSDVDRLRLELDAARRERAEAPRPRPAPEPVREGAVSEEGPRLKAAIDNLHRRLAEAEEHLQVTLRKAEHNRRAYLVTQMQLDLAEDKLYLLTTGKPRPIYEGTDSGNAGRPVAQDVEGYTYADDDSDAAPEAAEEGSDDALEPAPAAAAVAEVEDPDRPGA